jgi:hypothetical protein
VRPGKPASRVDSPTLDTRYRPWPGAENDSLRKPRTRSDEFGHHPHELRKPDVARPDEPLLCNGGPPSRRPEDADRPR